MPLCKIILFEIISGHYNYNMWHINGGVRLRFKSAFSHGKSPNDLETVNLSQSNFPHRIVATVK